MPYPVPSGASTFFIASMVRENRSRGESVPYSPAIAFDGNITDTEAVKAWVRDGVMPSRR